MAHIEISGQPSTGMQLVINGIDFTNETYRGFELVEVGPEVPEFAEVGLRITLAVSRLDLDTQRDIKITDQLPVVAQRVRTMQDEDV